jgi:hypothetical protein
MSGTTFIFGDVFENQTVAAVMDIFSLKAGAANGLALRSFELTAGATAAAIVRVRLKILPATVTNGTGGAAATPQRTDRKQAYTTTTTARQRDTTQAITSGTAAILKAWEWNVLGPLPYVPPTPEERETIGAGEALVLDLAFAPTSVPMSGHIVWEEW